LRIIVPASGTEKIIAQAVDRDDLRGHLDLSGLFDLSGLLGILLLHGGPRQSEDLDTSTLPMVRHAQS